jgi:hypothetical protein
MKVDCVSCIGTYLVFRYYTLADVRIAAGLRKTSVENSVPDPGSCIRCLFDPRLRDRFFPDPGSRMPDPKPIFFRA